MLQIKEPNNSTFGKTIKTNLKASTSASPDSVSSTYAGLQTNSWDLRWLVKCPNSHSQARAGSQGSLCEAPSDIWELGKRSLHASSPAFIWDLKDSTQHSLSGAARSKQRMSKFPWARQGHLWLRAKPSLDPRRPCYPAALLGRKSRQAPLARGPMWLRPVQRGEASVHTHTQLHNVHSAIWGQDRPQLYFETSLEFRFQLNKRTQRFKYH